MNDWADQRDHNKPVMRVGLCMILPVLVSMIFWAFVVWLIWRLF